MTTKTKTLKVRFITNNINGKNYLPGNYTVSGKDLEALEKAPYVTEISDEEKKQIKKAKEIETAARKAKGFYDDKDIEEGNQNDENDNNDDKKEEDDIKEDVKFTVDELAELPEEELRLLYETEQAKKGKTAPKNILRATIIENLTK